MVANVLSSHLDGSEEVAEVLLELAGGLEQHPGGLCPGHQQVAALQQQPEHVPSQGQRQVLPTCIIRAVSQ